MMRQVNVWKYAQKQEEQRGREIIKMWLNIPHKINIGKRMKLHHRQKIKWNAQRNTGVVIKNLSKEDSAKLLIKTVDKIIHKDAEESKLSDTQSTSSLQE